LDILGMNPTGRNYRCSNSSSNSNTTRRDATEQDDRRRIDIV